MKGQGEKGRKGGKKGGEGEEKEKKMEEISLNGGEGFQEASWGVGNVFKKFEEYTPLLVMTIYQEKIYFFYDFTSLHYTCSVIKAYDDF